MYSWSLQDGNTDNCSVDNEKNHLVTCGDGAVAENDWLFCKTGWSFNEMWF